MMVGIGTEILDKRQDSMVSGQLLVMRVNIFMLMLVLIKESNHEISLISTIHNKSVM